MRQLLPFAALALVAAFSSCGTPKDDGGDHVPPDSLEQAAVDLSAHHLPLLLTLPEGAPEPELVWKDEIGKLMVRAGDHFALEVYEAPEDLDRVKGDLERDLVQKNTVVDEGPGLLIYRSEFPDDTTLVFYHFNRSVTAGNRVFQVQDANGEGPFNLEEVRRMARAIAPKPAA